VTSSGSPPRWIAGSKSVASWLATRRALLDRFDDLIAQKLSEIFDPNLPLLRM